jgi:NADPH-dependent 2,4-dienoyl-CoA reductase/sulfur reductase-like enzyme/peroxiredoxin family protein/rhodanese-related sulfurtransferase/TusA-related sulfurtransferase
MPYYIGGTIPQRERLLVQTPAAMRRRFNIDVRIGTEIVQIDRGQKKVVAREVETGRQYSEPYDVLILSPGAFPVRPALPGIDSPNVLTLRGLADMDAIKSAIDQQKDGRAVVVGGGYIGMEMAEALRQRGLAVALVERGTHVFSAAIDPEMAAPLHEQLREKGVDLHLGTSVAAIEQAAGGLGAGSPPAGLVVRLSSGQSLPATLVIVAIGVRPEVTLAREAGLEIGPSGGIAVDAHMRTSDSDIYAVGDAVEVQNAVLGGGQRVLIPLAGPANRQGRIAADNALGRESVYRGTQGTAICKVFDLTVGLTGPSEKTLERMGQACEKVYVHPASHAGYYGGASAMSLKVLFDPGSGRVLGAQAVGRQGVDKRIDVLAVAIRAGMTVADLAHLELSYAPPYSSAKDPVNYAGFVASNALNGDGALCHAAEIASPGGDQFVLDVRTAEEFEAGTIPGAVNIPLDQLRDRMAELPREKEILAFCQVGLRGYLACRILSQNGLRCRNLSGGYKTFRDSQAVSAPATPVAGRGPEACETQRVAETQKVETQKVACEPPVKTIDARGQQCPGPIMTLKAELQGIAAGRSLTIVASDESFGADVAAWCRSTGNRLLEVHKDNGTTSATIQRTQSAATAPTATGPAPSAMPSTGTGKTLGQAQGKTPRQAQGKTIVLFSDDFDKAVAAFIIANGAAAMGSDVTIFFTFWGLNVLRSKDGPGVPKTMVERMFGWMMPRGPSRLTLSKMNMMGMGGAMIRGIMRKKHVLSLEELIRQALAGGVKLVACSMSMDLMGIKAAELIDGVAQGGVATYLDTAQKGNVNLFI